MAAIRLQKLLAACGIGSRRACEELIAQGRVLVDGVVVSELGTKVDPELHEVRCDGARLRPPRLRYYLLNKPRGVICSTKSLPGKPKAIDFVPPEALADRLFTVGRLDVDSEGALLLTNDGELCHRITHPRFEVEKSYRVEVEGFADDDTIAKMRKGVWLAEGRTSSLKIRMIARRPDRTVLDMTLNEGMKREIRRVCARFGHEVKRLIRMAIGPVRLEHLPVGAVRELSDEEIAALVESADAVIKLGSRPHAGRRPARGRRAEAARRHGERATDEPERATSGRGARGRAEEPAPEGPPQRGGRAGARERAASKARKRGPAGKTKAHGGAGAKGEPGGRPAGGRGPGGKGGRPGGSARKGPPGKGPRGRR